MVARRMARSCHSLLDSRRLTLSGPNCLPSRNKHKTAYILQTNTWQKALICVLLVICCCCCKQLLAGGTILPLTVNEQAALYPPQPLSGQLDLALAGAASGKQVLAATELVAAKEGADLDLSCPIEVPSEDMIISWSCENEPANIRSSRVHVTEAGKLRIRSAKVGDSCNYRCEAAEGFGTVSVIIKVLIVNPRQLDCLSSGATGSSSSGGGGGGASSGLVRACQLQQQYQPEAPSDGQSSPSLSPVGALARRENLASGSNSDDSLKQLDLDVQLEPAVVRVDKGRTISLECRVMRPALAALAPSSAPASGLQLLEPSIIWLKEFIGQSPSSLSEAHEQNLALIDGVYYHSLNWPRSITYKRRAGGLHSALLVRQASYLHSGKYICFAGYPPYTMGRNLSLDNANHESSKEHHAFATSSKPASAHRYRMAVSRVQVNDPEGFRRHQEMFAASGTSSLSSSSWFQLSLMLQTNSNWLFRLLLQTLHALSLCIIYLYVSA